jgi:uncharacterized MAPEG superfamily protein
MASFVNIEYGMGGCGCVFLFVSCVLRLVLKIILRLLEKDILVHWNQNPRSCCLSRDGVTTRYQTQARGTYCGMGKTSFTVKYEGSLGPHYSYLGTLVWVWVHLAFIIMGPVDIIRIIGQLKKNHCPETSEVEVLELREILKTH